MRTKEHKDTHSELLSLKQASLARALSAARAALASGQVRTRSVSSSLDYPRSLRVPST